MMMRRTEDMLRKMAGAPSRKEEEKMRHRERKQRTGNGQRHQETPDPHPARAMREVAEDVEFVEIKDYSETEDILSPDGSSEHKEYHESQVEDIKFTEIK